MRAGTARRRITPPTGIPMGGFGFRDHGADGVRDDLFVRCLWLEEEATGNRLLILALDVHALDDATVTAWKASIERQWGVPPSAVLLSATHSHSGPLMVDRCYGDAGADQDYLARLHTRVLEAVAEAAQTEADCTLAFGRGEQFLGISRRRPTENGIRFSPYPEGYVERDLPVIQVRDARGGTLCILFSAAAHPSLLTDYLFSAEYPGAACRFIEQAAEGRALALFLQGACGEIKVNTNADTRRSTWTKGSGATVERAGRLLADAVLQTLADDMAPVQPHLTFALKIAALPLALPDDPAAYYASLCAPRAAHPFASDTVRLAARRWAEHHRARLQRGESIPRTLACPVQRIGLAEGVEMIAVAGELTSGLARILRRSLPDPAPIFLGYANGMLGYLPSEAMLPEGGYEVFDSIFYFPHLPGPLAPGLEAALVAAIGETAPRPAF